jgi:hypothetical protein
MKRFVPFQRYILALFAALLALSLSGCEDDDAKIKALEAQVKTLQAQVHITNDIDSPVRAVGGSMIIFADSGWAGPVNGQYTSQDTPILSAVTVAGRENLVSGTTDVLVSALAYSWTIAVNGRNSGHGVTLCAEKDCDTTTPLTASTTGSVYLNADNDGKSSFYNHPVVNLDTKVPVGMRFFDADSHSANTAGTVADDADLTERIKEFVVTVGKNGGGTVSGTYHCPEGECRICIGK